MATEELLPKSSTYWMTSIKDDDQNDTKTLLEDLVVKRKIFVVGTRTPGRTKWKSGDWVCFYAAGKGVVGHAMMTSSTHPIPKPILRANGKYEWAVKLDKVRLYFDDPVIVDVDLRNKLDAFRSKGVFGNWSWFVQASREVTEHDFRILTRQP